MKTIKNKLLRNVKLHGFILIILFAIFPIRDSREQMIVSDPATEGAMANQIILQSEQLTQAMHALTVAKESYQTYQYMKNDIMFLKDQAQVVEQRLHNISNLQDLNINGIMNFLARTNCFLGNGYYYLDNRYLYLGQMLMSNILSCNNDQLYMTTFSGMRKKMVDQGYWKVPVGYTGNAQTDMFNINQSRRDLHTNLKKANDLHDMSSNAYQANSLDVSQRMKALSKTIDSLGTRMEYLSKCESCNYSEYERVMLYQKGLDLHIQAMDYNNKAYELEKKATGLSAQDANTLADKRYNMLVKECMVFRKY